MGFVDAVIAANTRKLVWMDADPKTRSTVMIPVPEGQVSVTPAALELIYDRFKGIAANMKEGNTASLDIGLKVFTFTKNALTKFEEVLSEKVAEVLSSITALVTSDTEVVVAITAGDPGTFDVNGAAISVDAALAVVSFADDSAGTIEVFENDGEGNPGAEMTGADLFADGDIVIATAEDGVATATYFVSGATG